MPYVDEERSRNEKGRYELRRNRVAAKPILKPLQLRSPRQALACLADAVNMVRADQSADAVTTARVQIDAARAAGVILASNFDSKIDELATRQNAIIAENRALREALYAKGDRAAALALPVASDKDGTPLTPVKPLAGALYDPAAEFPVPVPPMARVKRKYSKRHQAIIDGKVPPPPSYPTADVVSATLEDFNGNPTDDDEIGDG